MRTTPFRRSSTRALFLLLVSSFAPAGAHAAGAPLRIDDPLPERLSLTFVSRARYEFLNNRFRVRTSGDADIQVFRTLIHARFKATDQLTFGAEMIDARSYLQDGPVSTGIVNAVELLQGYTELDFEWPPGGTSKLRAGRITMNVGSRRFVARNRFRNTINAFTGIDWRWKGEGQREARAFWTLPVQRRPFRPKDTEDNKIQFDRETIDVQFAGLFYGDSLPGEHRGELFVFGLYEDDTDRRPTRNRQLVTPGFRFWKPPTRGALDYMIESALQFGESRANPLSTRDLDHFAHFHHVEVGWSFDAPASPRLLAQFDYASGDDDPTDGKNGRFNTLFGARRFDFGPTGIYGPFARSNLITPGLRLRLKPTQGVSSFLSLRAFWLASDRDAWVAAGLRDPTGQSGSYLGTQIELRVRWDVLTGNLRLESGLAHLFTGGFRDDAPLSNGQGDATYVYAQATVRF
jgi:hypothetical protein